MRRRINNRPISGNTQSTPSAQSSASDDRQLHLALVGLFILCGTALTTWSILRFPEYTLQGVLPPVFFTFLVLGIIGWLSWVALGLFALATVGFVLNNSLGAPMRLTGAGLWFLGGFWAFVVALSYFARYIAPPLNEEVRTGSFQGLRLLLDFAFRRTGARPTAYEVRPSELPDSFRTLGVGALPNHRAMTVMRDGRHYAVRGPGYTMLHGRQAIRDMVDLRSHSRQEHAGFSTRDGILFQADVRVDFRVEPDDSAETDTPGTFNRDAIRRLSEADMIHSDEERVHTFERVTPRASLYAAEAISRRSLDDLYRINDPERQPLTLVTMEVKQRLADEFRPKGIHIDSVDITNITLREDIIATRIKQWEATWKPQKLRIYVDNSVRLPNREDVQIQMEVLDELMRQIEIVRQQSHVPISQEIADRLDKIIREVATEGMLRTMIPEPPFAGDHDA